MRNAPKLTKKARNLPNRRLIRDFDAEFTRTHTTLNENFGMARNTNNELVQLPGFFFYPRCADGLAKLTDRERFTLLFNQGNYVVDPEEHDPELVQSQLNACENGRIPTHRRPDAIFPGYGSVAVDLREVIDLKGE